MHTSLHGAPPHCEAILVELRSLARPGRLQGMARFGIDTSKALGVQIPELRNLARISKKGRTPAERHELAAALWQTGLHEPRILASMVDAPQLVPVQQLDAWAADFRSWDLCDQCCNNLFRHTDHGWDKAAAWAALGADGPEFTVRAGFVLMATLCVAHKQAPHSAFEPFWPLILEGCTDPRNFVKKGVNWALRQLGKRNAAFNARAVALAEEMLQLRSPAARWIASDALRELCSAKVRERHGLQ